MNPGKPAEASARRVRFRVERTTGDPLLSKCGNSLRALPRNRTICRVSPGSATLRGRWASWILAQGSNEDDTMLRARSKNWPALAVLAGLLVGPNAIAQEKPKDAAAPAQAKPARAVAAKDAKKEPDAPKQVGTLSGASSQARRTLPVSGGTFRGVARPSSAGRQGEDPGAHPGHARRPAQ